MRKAKTVSQFGKFKTGRRAPGAYPTKFEVCRLEYREGDILVLRTDMMLDKKQVDFLRMLAEEQFKPFRVVVVTGIGLAVLSDQGTVEQIEGDT